MVEEIIELAPILPELLLFVSALGLLVLGAFQDDENGSTTVTLLAVIALLVAALLAVGVRGTDVRVTFGGHFIFDSFASFTKVLIYGGVAGALLLSRGYMRDERIERFEYPVLAVFAALGMGMLASTNSLLALYMGFELMSLPLYVMASFHRDTLRSSEAGLKYFILGALSSGMLLYGCSLIYGFTGTLMFDRMGEIVTAGEFPTGAVVGLVFLISGFAFKMSAVPFHMWTPDVYEGAPTPVTAFFAAAPKVAAMALTLRVLMQPLAEQVIAWQQVIILISILSMTLGAFAAIGQQNIKRLMAYSSIGHIGYALVGLSAGTQEGVYGVLVYMAIYLFMTLGTFGCILMMRRHGRYIERIDDLAGLSNRQPLMAAILLVMMFSLAGIPPLAGFIAKLYVFRAAVDAGLVWLVVIAVLTNVVGAYYYIRIVKLMYFDPEDEPLEPVRHPGVNGVALITGAFTALFIFLPGPLLSAAQSAAEALSR